jgi:nicotinate-nucleotide adenylyltransferase
LFGVEEFGAYFMKRIGIYAGAFDPVHAGHIAFALQAMERAELDRIYFMPERRPCHKQGVEHFGHRMAMIERALKPHPKFGTVDLVDVHFSVPRTLPQLLKRFRGQQLVFLFGSDAVTTLPSWPNVERLLKSSELVIGVLGEAQLDDVKRLLAAWPLQPKALHLFESYAADVSSGRVREALRKRQPIRGLLTSVARYSNRHWLYISLR